MSVRVMTWVFDEAPTANATDQLVLLAIADRCSDDGTDAYPSFATLARKTRLDRSTVIRSIERLKHAGVLEVVSGAIKHRANVYRVKVDQSRSATSRVAPLVAQRHHSSRTAPPDQSRSATIDSGAAPPDPSGTSSTSCTSEEELTLQPLVHVPGPEDLQSAWNELTSAPIPRCSKLDAARRRHAEARLQEHGLDGMRAVFTRINSLPFCRGENDRGWRASFDWALKPASIAKVMEGNYDRQRGQSVGRTGAPAPGKYAGIEERDELVGARAS